ncbi:hypothetical protein ASA1KI_25000 [Opitutales bacterium ASA1]|uniref:EamA family transporter n=1 Tax=Congregicoccus parvus TaxID=3081749 RepID=UPI002B2DAA44|nr:hypothetical protein ASA1KI_25000 [Opitutales bacterium ASA1]
MSWFLALCLISRFAYALNDVLTGRLAREYGRVEVAAMRGVSLGVSMGPFLLFVPGAAWAELASRGWEVALVVGLTGVLNVLQLHAARLLPFGVRAAFILSGMALTSGVLGWMVLGEEASGVEVALAILVVGSAVVAALGDHATADFRPDIRRGACYALAAAVLMAVVALFVTRLSRATHPLLTAWVWEFGAGLVLVIPWWIGAARRKEKFDWVRVRRIAAASSPTVLGSGASTLALVQGALGVWAAVAGTQVLFTALLGAWMFRERVGPLRWVCFGVAAIAVGGLAVSGK